MTADTRFQQVAQELGHDFGGEIKIGGNYTPVMREGQYLPLCERSDPSRR